MIVKKEKESDSNETTFLESYPLTAAGGSHGLSARGLCDGCR